MILRLIRRRKIEFNIAINESLLLWLRKWSLEEDWEGELNEELPKIFK